MDRIIEAFKNSIKGLVAVYESEKAFREDLYIAAAFLPFALFSHITPGQRALLILSLFLILICELINTAIETVVDRISKDHHPLSGKAKDIGSAVVLLAFVNAAVTWIFIIV